MNDEACLVKCLCIISQPTFKATYFEPNLYLSSAGPDQEFWPDRNRIGVNMDGTEPDPILPF